MAVLKHTRVATTLAALALTGFVGATPAPAHADTGVALEQALAESFAGAHIERRTLALSPADLRRVEVQAHARSEARLVTAYIAWRGDTLEGAAFTDRRVVRTREALLFVAVAPDTSIARIDVLGFFEPPDYRPVPRWLGLFRGRGARAPLTPPLDVREISGATLTSRAVNESARLGLAWYELLLAPELARGAPAAGAP